ncbi:Na(+)/H(+) antiporter subunit D [Limisalsivibrio acetivorans]|uniref:Na(+)/H(+) antiporter subunit D n=1 Tax=Limisalsivibrio acetivorans TaxID=1304888 RepID=UPI0003B705C2|nr:Na(+)/H(+) antiporter subunit D [Limisalsivibrio acetivorans]
MSSMIIPPVFYYLAGALLLMFIKTERRELFYLRNAVLFAVPVISFLHLIQIPEGVYLHYSFLSMDLALFRIDKLSLIFGYAFLIVSVAVIFYGMHLRSSKEFIIGLIYAGCGLGAVFAYDLISLYIFWEVMTVASTFLIWQKNTDEATQAGFRYFVFHLAGGLALLIGIVIYIITTGNTAFEHMGWTDTGTFLIMIGFGVNAAWPFLHTWLVDVYPRASFLGTVMLSVFTTKTAIYTLARGFAGEEILIVAGAIMTAFPIFFAVLENDLRKVLSYSLINQLGFMVVGIGVGTAMAVNAAVGQAFVHIMFKSLLFMGMGAVLHQTGKIKASELGGLYKYMPITTIFTIIGSATISAFPLFSAFVTKSMILSSVAYEGLAIVWLVLLFASAGVLDHSGIKIPFFAFFGHDSGLRPKEAPTNMLIGMGILAFISIFIGVYPPAIYNIMPYAVDYNPYTGDHVVAQMQLLLFSILAFTLLLRSGMYPAEIKAINLDFDWFYRKGARAFVWVVDNPFMAFMNRAKVLFFEAIPVTLSQLSKNPLGLLLSMVSNPEQRVHINRCIISEKDAYLDSMKKHWSIGLSVMLVILFLMVYLLIFLFVS